MNFKASISKNKIEISSKLPVDNYKKYLDKFVDEFGPIIKDNVAFLGLINPLLSSKSYRLLNRELRKSCDQYCTDHKLMNHAQFQERWFYESVMLERVTIGAKSPWIDNKTVIPAKQVPSKVTQAKFDSKPVTSSKATQIDVADVPPVKSKKTKPYVWDLSQEWDKANKAIYDTLYPDNEDRVAGN